MHGIAIETDKASYRPGETVNATAHLHLGKTIEARGIEAIVFYHEKKIIRGYTAIPPDEVRRMEELGMKVTSPIKPTESYREDDVWVWNNRLAPAGSFGNQEYRFSLRLPDDASPTSHQMGHDDRIVIWKMRVKLDIPWGLDFSTEKEIVVEGL